MKMRCQEPSDMNALLRWEEGKVDVEREHFRLFHRTISGPVAWVGPRTPVGLRAQFREDLTKDVRDEVRDELWSWCTPQTDDPFFGVDLWHNLAEFALRGDPSGSLRWEFVPCETEHSFVEEVTSLYTVWRNQADSDLQGPPEEVHRKRERRAAFLRDYVTIFAIVDRDPRQTLCRLARLVRLQTGDDPTAQFDIQLMGPSSGEVHMRVGQFEDFDFADAWACAAYEGFVVTKLRRSPRLATPTWSRSEVRNLLRLVDGSLAAEVPSGGLVAETDGPCVRVRFSRPDPKPISRPSFAD